MNKAFVVAATVFTAGSGALAFDTIDQLNDVQGQGQGWSYLNPYFEASQSFKPSANKISGAGVYLGTYWGNSDVTIGIYYTDPYSDGGANPVPGATGTTKGGQAPGWVDVFWSPVSVTPGQTYYLAPTGPGGSGVIDYTYANTYANGDLYWYGSPPAQDYYDMVFRTYAPVPSPGSAAVLGLGGLVASRRRRA